MSSSSDLGIKPHIVKLDYEPHEGNDYCVGGQVRLIALTLAYRTVTAAVGRRWGKTQAAMMAIQHHMAQPKYKGRRFIAAYCGPTYKAAMRQFDEALDFFGGMEAKGGLVIHKNRQEGMIRLKAFNGHTGATIHFWSLEDPDNLRGARLDFCVIDEANIVKEHAVSNVIRPMLIDTAGHILIIGTPDPAGVGFQWFRRSFLLGQDMISESAKDYASMQGPSEGNPFMDPKIIQQERLAARMVSRVVERSEYDAEFCDNEGAVFERIEEAMAIEPHAIGQHIFIHPGYRNVKPHQEFVIGYDVGRHDDWAIITVWHVESRTQVYLWRGIKMQFSAQVREISRIHRMFNEAPIYADNNGMGESVFEDLAFCFGDGVVGRKWSPARKEADITRGMMLFQNASWKFLKVPWQTQMFYAFIRIKLPAGGYRYEASAGDRDDAVAAACLIAHRLVIPLPEVIEKEVPKHNMLYPDGTVDRSFWERARDPMEDYVAYE